LLSNYCEHKNYESHQLNTIVAQSNDNIISPHSTGSCNSTPEHIHSPLISNNSHEHDIPNDHNSQQANNTIANSVTNVFPPPTTGNNSISVCFFNARSLVNKLDLFKSYVLSTFHDIICVTETWLSDNIFNAEILPPSYSIHRNDRATRGGGVLIAVKDSLPITNVDRPVDIEMVSVTLKLSNPLTIGCIYLPPNAESNHTTHLCSYLSDNLDLQNTTQHDIILVGDFNFPDINWATLSAHSPSSTSFCDFVFDSNLTQLIDSPTHSRGNILDLILTNTSHAICSIEISSIPHQMESDHAIITFETNLSVSAYNIHPPPQLVFDYTKADYTGLCNHLMDTDFSQLYHSNDVNVSSVCLQPGKPLIG